MRPKELDIEKFFEYFDSGVGTPYDEEEVVAFCVAHFNKFSDGVDQINKGCWNCEKDYDYEEKEEEGMDKAYIFNFYDHEEDYNLVAQYISDLEPFEDIDEQEAQISILPCKKCGYWIVTH